MASVGGATVAPGNAIGNSTKVERFKVAAACSWLAVMEVATEG